MSFMNWDKLHPLAKAIVIAVTVGFFLSFFFLLVRGDGHEPPAFMGDWHPEHQVVCANADITLDEVADINDFWADLGWPTWPEPHPAHNVCWPTARDGEVQWRSCSTRLPDGRIPCQGEHGDEVRRRFDENDNIIAVDIFLEAREDRLPCSPLHGSGHARGLGGSTFWDEHTTAASNLMADPCGPSLRWLDRTEGGDWPYGG